MALVNMYQLKKMSNVLHSYDAGKVQTKVAKPDGGTYTVEELFAKVVGDIKSVSDLLKAFKGKKISDIVRLELDVDHDKVELPEKLDEKIPGIDKSIHLPAYSEDNTLLLDQTGNPLKINLETGMLSGTPSVINTEATAQSADGTPVYKEIAVTKLKVFPTGEWTLEDLPTGALLDNEELQLLAYRSAVDKIVVELAKDADLIANIKKQIGTRAIEDALAEKAALTDVYAKSADDKLVPLYRKMTDKITRADLDDALEAIMKGEEQLQKDAKALRDDITAMQELHDHVQKDGPIKVDGIHSWEQDHEYHVDEIVRFDNKNYICKKHHTSSADVKPIKYGDYWIQLNDGQKFFAYEPHCSQVELYSYVTDSTTETDSHDILVNRNEAHITRPIEVLKYDNEAITVKEKEFISETLDMDKVIQSKSMISTKDYKVLSSITIGAELSDTSKIMMAVTNDGKTYYTHNFETAEWSVVDINEDGALLADGIDSAKIADITASAWTTINTTGEIGFAYIMHKEKDEDKCALVEAMVSGVLPDFIRSAANNTEYTYRYTDAETLQLRFKQAGKYLVNYSSGYKREEF